MSSARKPIIDQSPQPVEKPPAASFLHQIVEGDLARGTHAGRRWGGAPGDAVHHAAGAAQRAALRTRFPPEPNGFLHIGHAKSICLNFSLAQEYGGVCHLRFDDTNPEKEEQQYVDSIIDAVRWLGFDWRDEDGRECLYYASDYFAFMYRAAEYLILHGLAYVDEQSAEQMRSSRGDFSRPGTNSPYRARSVAENLARFAAMRDGLVADGGAVLRAKIDMASPNLNLRDPALYRVRHARHHRSGDAWCIYPMYTFAHPIEDALECITHSICTLEFEDQRPFYDWLLGHLAAGGLIATPAPRQYEFARLNLTHVVTSKRKLRHLVDSGIVSGWDDPRLPTLAGLRRRGYTPHSIRSFCRRIGVSKENTWIEYATLEACLREDLEASAPRAMAVVDGVVLELTNWAEAFGSNAYREDCTFAARPHGQEGELRHMQLGREVWIAREDFSENPPKGYKRLFAGNRVRLKGGYVVECTGCVKDALGQVSRVLARVLPGTKSGTPGADSVKARAAITWVDVQDALEVELRLYEHLFTDAQPDAGEKDWLAALNPHSMQVLRARVEPSLAQAQNGARYQFERMGYFAAERQADASLVFQRITTLKDTWGNKK